MDLQLLFYLKVTVQTFSQICFQSQMNGSIKLSEKSSRHVFFVPSSCPGCERSVVYLYKMLDNEINVYQGFRCYNHCVGEENTVH